MDKDFKLETIEHGTPAYEEEVRLRDAILRRPLGLEFSSEELSDETDSIHLGCFRGVRLTGCLVLKPLGTVEIQMRQVAVDPEHQGGGIGRALVNYAEQVAKERGFKRMVLHARQAAVPFYEMLNYQKQGEEFIELSIPHQEMSKEL